MLIWNYAAKISKPIIIVALIVVVNINSMLTVIITHVR
jgi:hypothetical protein